MLKQNPDIEDLKAVAGEYREILLSTMNLIADRYEGDADYHWIDTKLNIVTGKDFPLSDSLRGKNVVYSWIQGRGLESLTLHSKWILKNFTDKTSRILVERLKSIVMEVANSICRARELNAGHLFFFLNPSGEALNLEREGILVKKPLIPDNPWNTSDIFASRGLFAASCMSGDVGMRSSSVEYINDVFNGINSGNYMTDQQPLTEGNPVASINGRLSHSPWMLMIGSKTLLLRNGISEALESGLDTIRYILDNHVNINGKWDRLRDFDYVEYIGTGDDLWYTGGKVLSDPGHALEFVGLAARFLSAALSSNSPDSPGKQKISEIASLMFPIFRRNFTNGFNRDSGGLVKLTDLLTRQTVNEQMPWWSLPEAMRAALGCCELVTNDTEKTFCMEAYSLCHNSFISNYIQADSPGLLAVQTRGEDGNIIDSIPAVPDADPGYHTGLSLIDCLEMIDEY